MEKFKNLPIGTLIRHPNFGIGIVVGSYNVNYRVSFKSYYDQKNLLGSFVDNNCSIEDMSKMSFEDVLKRGAYFGLFKPDDFNNAIDLAKNNHVLEICKPINGVFEGTVRAESIYHPIVEYSNGVLSTSCDCKGKTNCVHALAMLLYMNKNKVEFKEYARSKYLVELINNKENILNLIYANDDCSFDSLTKLDELLDVLKPLSIRDFGELIKELNPDVKKATFIIKMLSLYPRIKSIASKIIQFDPTNSVPFIKAINDTKYINLPSVTSFYESYLEKDYRVINPDVISNKTTLPFIAFHFDKYYPHIKFIKDQLFEALASKHLLKYAVDKLDDKTANLVYVDNYPLFVKEGTSDRVITTKDVLLAIQESTNNVLDILLRISFIVKKCIKENNEALLVQTLYKIAKNNRLKIDERNQIFSIINSLPDNELVKITFMELLNDKPRFHY